MDNPSQPGYNPGQANVPAHLAGAKAIHDAANDDDERRDEEEDTLFNENTPEERGDLTEADKEADARPEDFESFNVDKVDDLQETKEESEGPDAE